MFEPKMRWKGIYINSFEMPWLLRLILRHYRVQVRTHPNGMVLLRK